ncbi:MAG TPA: ATP-binding protein [Actinomycetota bacterium]|jgi:two-component system sensor histidine kinase KdpD
MSREVSEPRSTPLTVRGVLVAVLGPTAATAAALLLAERSPSAAVALYMLAVVGAAVAGGFWSGLVAAGIASFAFGATYRTYAAGIDESGDVVAAVVFLAVALVVGLLVGSAAEERHRAARREREAQLLSHLSTKLLSGEVPDRVLDDFAWVLLDPLGLASCEITATIDGTEIRARAERPGSHGGGPIELVPLVVGNVPFGSLTAERPAGRRALTKEQRSLLEAATRQAAATLDRARLDARARLAQLDAETNELRAAMFSSVTHDLRTPLASIKAGVTSLLDPSATHDPTQERDLLTTILEETDRLNRLVGNILDLAKIRAGALTPAREPTAIDEVVESALARLRPQFEGLTVRAELAPDLPDVWVDPVQIDQVLANLIENAIRHSPSGGTVEVGVARRDGFVQVRVVDEGPGIPEDERERVFDAFYRGEKRPERPGSGLGLAIAKAVVVAHGGRIWIEERPGGGTAVVFELGMEEVHA